MNNANTNDDDGYKSMSEFEKLSPYFRESITNDGHVIIC